MQLNVSELLDATNLYRMMTRWERPPFEIHRAPADRRMAYQLTPLEDPDNPGQVVHS